MKFVDRLLRRAGAPARGAQPPAVDPRIATIIEDALAKAGLGRASAGDGGVGAVIDQALSRAGLRTPAASAEPRVERGRVDDATRARPADDAAPQGRFLARRHAGAHGALDYKLYLPVDEAANGARRLPLLVMLHGCTQSPDDFAAGTRMNALADRHRLLVAYPAQSPNANGSKCWNWFRPQDQARDGGEPALLAGLVAQLAAELPVDPARIYVAGLSAGGAMAVVLGRTHPELFAAVGVHSGLPYRAAHDVGSAFAAMQRVDASNPGHAGGGLPTIVFHGDTDRTVAHDNGAAVARHALGGDRALARDEDSGIARGGHRWSRTRYRDADGRSVVEDWRVHGAGHAWMGGSSAGTYTDPRGPDASAEMIRFFLQHAK